MRRVETILKSRREPEALRHKLGPRRQRRRRKAERAARISALVVTRWARAHGLTSAQSADRFGMDASTLKSWQERWVGDRLQPHARGRPANHVDRDHLWSVLSVFGLIGPQVGLPTLQNLFPDIARSALISLQIRLRAIYRRKTSWVIDTSRWTCPGAVWAIDFSELPDAIEGLYTHLILVRDLASGYVLIAISTLGQSTIIVLHVLASLFRWFGVPLVIKMDNGGPLITDEVKELLRSHGVLPVYSPPGTPSYNGAVEAGIGSIKHRAFWRAAFADRPGQWTSDDIEAAVRDANTHGRPRGIAAPAPQDAWRNRVPITGGQRRSLHDTVSRLAEEEYARRGIQPMAQLQHHEQASIDRAAISRALVELGFLLIRRKRITPPISRLGKRKIS